MHDDRLEVTALAVAQFAEVLGVDPTLVAKAAAVDRSLEEFERLYRAEEDAIDGLVYREPNDRPEGVGIQKR